MALYTTEMDACFIGCGEPLVFLKWNQGAVLLFWCPSCRGIWDEDLLDMENRDPELYDVRGFGNQSLTTPSLEEIGAIWNKPVVTRIGREEEEFGELLAAFFGSKLCFPKQESKTENEDKEEEKGTSQSCSAQ